MKCHISSFQPVPHSEGTVKLTIRCKDHTETHKARMHTGFKEPTCITQGKGKHDLHTDNTKKNRMLAPKGSLRFCK